MSLNYRNFAFIFILFVSLLNSKIQVFGQDEFEDSETEGPPNNELIVSAGPLGLIRGAKFWTAKTFKPYYVFAGIPYAKEIKPEKRFQPSELFEGPLAPPEEQPYRATRPLVMCPQPGGLPSGGSSGLLDEPFSYLMKHELAKHDQDVVNNLTTTKGSTLALGTENCLTLTVHTRKIPRSDDDKLLPVTLYIHGGSFTSLWGTIFNGGRLLETEMVLVSMNYRLGVLGFFNLGINEAPGNGGLYDMLTALKWVQEYVKHFGGDPGQVTIMGQSAGGASVIDLMVSPLAKGLFHKAIAGSGTGLLEWATCEDPITHSLRIAEIAGCYTGTEEPLAVTQCMHTLDAADMVNAMNAYTKEERLKPSHGFWAGTPSIQNPNLDIPIFLKEMPLQTMLKGEQSNVPLMMGALRHDGAPVLQVAYDEFLVPKDLLDDPKYIKNHLLGDILKVTGVEDKTNAAIDALAETYIGEAKDSETIEPKYPGLIDLFSVFFFKAMTYRTLQLHSIIQNQSYFYSFDFRGTWSLTGILNIGGPFPMGVAHADDILYLFHLLPLITRDEMGVSDRFTTYTTNFIEHGNPNGPSGNEPWPAYSNANPLYLAINKVDSVENNYKKTWKHASDELFKPKS